mgnify:CR=1 FL=1
MYKVINGRRYNTQTAKEIATWESDYPTNDFHYYEEALYRKQTGEFFLYGKGHAASPYAESAGQNASKAGEKIIPMTFEEAKKWAEESLDGAVYDRIFPPLDAMEGLSEEKRQVNLWIPKDMYEMLKKESDRTGRSMTELFTLAIITYFNS